MEESIFPLQPGFKLNKERAIYIGTFLGGPLVAGYLTAENFKQLGQQDKVKKTWIIAIVATILIFGGIFLIPDIDKVPRIIIPLLYTMITGYLVKHFQGAAIAAHVKNGGRLYSVWRAVLAGLIGTLILLAIIVVIALLLDYGSL